MQKLIYIKYDELYLKGKNIDYFKQKALSNLTKSLIGINVKITSNYDSITISDFDENDIEILLYIIKRIPGFNYCTIAYKIDRSVLELNLLCENLLDKNKTFKIEVKRIDKSYEYNSDSLKRMVASHILMKNPMKVNVHNPEQKINIEVRKTFFIVFKDKIKCAGGLPISTSGKVLMLLSGGIDSPVASDLLMKRGMHVDFLTFITPPHTTENALNKVKELVRLITLNYRLEKPRLYICNYTNIQNELSHIENESYRITLLRRSFLRIANNIANLHNYDVLATGDALGQVASQTIESLNVIDEASDKLILRPLIAFSKNEIINHAKKINTYNESIKPYDDSCSLFAPKKPVTKPKLLVAKELENKLFLLHDLERNIINNIDVISYDKKQ